MKARRQHGLQEVQQAQKESSVKGRLGPLFEDLAVKQFGAFRNQTLLTKLMIGFYRYLNRVHYDEFTAYLRSRQDLMGLTVVCHAETKGATGISRWARFFCSNSLHQPLISVSLKILPMTRRRRPFKF
jgi:hypothetical protein